MPSAPEVSNLEPIRVRHVIPVSYFSKWTFYFCSVSLNILASQEDIQPLWSPLMIFQSQPITQPTDFFAGIFFTILWVFRSNTRTYPSSQPPTSIFWSLITAKLFTWAAEAYLHLYISYKNFPISFPSIFQKCILGAEEHEAINKSSDTHFKALWLTKFNITYIVFL